MALPSPQSATREQPPLLRLPAELRDTIYELVAVSGGDDIVFEYTTAVNIHVNLAAACR